MALWACAINAKEMYGPNPVDRSQPAAGHYVGDVSDYSCRCESGRGCCGAFPAGTVPRDGAESAGGTARALAGTPGAGCELAGGGCGGVADAVCRCAGGISERICSLIAAVPRLDVGKVERTAALRRSFQHYHFHRGDAAVRRSQCGDESDHSPVEPVFRRDDQYLPVADDRGIYAVRSAATTLQIAAGVG
ncbi:hypothetical protein D3C75_868200 [compost metagenome]